MNIIQNQLTHPKYRADIDGLRAIAVLSVVIFHAFPTVLPGGFVGVDIFFVISGFLISSIILGSLLENKFSFTEFYSRRIKRIFPALILVLAFTHAFGWFSLLSDEYKQLGKHIASGAGFISNITLWHESGYFDNAAETKPLLHLWSLGIEEQFYIVWPLAIWIAWKYKLNILTLTITLATSSLLLNLYNIKQDSTATFFSPQTRFWELLAGSILAWLILDTQNQITKIGITLNHLLNRLSHSEPSKNKSRNLIPNILNLVGALILCYSILRINKNLSFPGKWAILPVTGALFIILAGPRGWINRNILSTRILIWVGLISFPLYLWHWPLLSFARIIEGEIPSREIRASAVLIAIVLAWMTYRFLETPIRFGRINTKTITAPILGFLMIAMGSAGYQTYVQDGYDDRPHIANYTNNKNELNRISASNDECFDYIGIKQPLFPYCKFSDAKSSETVAVIGDSHAHVAFQGISEILSKRGINTLLLANSGCPPLSGLTTGTSNETEKKACTARIEQLLSIVTKHQDIRNIFVFTRGMLYVTGSEPVSGNQDLFNGQKISIKEFETAAQDTFNDLVKHGKTIFYVAENPELKYSPASCLNRPFKSKVNDCSIEKQDVMTRQSEYRSVVSNLKNITVIDSLDIFCPNEKCSAFDENGALLYADDDHLSIAGSRFQANRLLYPYLNTIKNNNNASRY